MRRLAKRKKKTAQLVNRSCNILIIKALNGANIGPNNGDLGGSVDPVLLQQQWLLERQIPPIVAFNIDVVLKSLRLRHRHHFSSFGNKKPSSPTNKQVGETVGKIGFLFLDLNK